MRSISENVFCEASPNMRTVRNTLTSELLYIDEPSTPVLSTFAGADGCYFLDEKGHVELYNPISQQLGYFTYTDDNLSKVKKWDAGFAALAGERHMTVRLTDLNALIEYTDADSDGCIITDDGTGFLCGEHKEAINADKIYAGKDFILILKDNVLKAFTREKMWSKKVQTLFIEPALCLGGIGSVPEDCELISYKNKRQLYKTVDGDSIYYYVTE
jgi:hypothetical protein